MTLPSKDLSYNPHYAYGSLCACGDLLTVHRTHAKSGKSPPSIAVVATTNAAAAVSTTEVVAVVVATAAAAAAAAALPCLQWPCVARATTGKSPGLGNGDVMQVDGLRR
jgi:hypothetical protein